MTIENNNSTIDMARLYRDEQYMPLLPLLEESFNIVKVTYPGISVEKHQALVNYALDWEDLDYWQSQAVRWLEEGLALSLQIVSKLTTLTNTKGLSPEVSTRIVRLLAHHTLDADVMA